tara:strand:+ start:506 stop:907 length:402 start_codon:yes stop_codon:yes gene_type:complete
MKPTSKIHIIIAILALVFATKLKGQHTPVPVDYNISSDFELKPIPPELIPYQIIPLDPVPDCRLELGIELIYPQSIMNLPEPQREETLEIIYKRVAYEISNPDKYAGLFQVDGRMYHLIRIPYTGASSLWEWE